MTELEAAIADRRISLCLIDRSEANPKKCWLAVIANSD